MKTIPKIIHQTWKTDPLPYPFDTLADTWQEMHPDWQYKLWTDEMNRNFIATHYPEFLNRYDSYPKNIQRVDAFRYFILLKEGGVYVDADFECLINISPLLKGAGCVIGKEPKLHCERFNMDMILCNAFMASTPNNAFMQFVCNNVKLHPSIEVQSPVDVLTSTGPFLLTNAYYKYENKQEVQLIEPETIYPITMFESKKVFNDTITNEMQQRIDKAYAVHYFWGNW